MLVLGAAVFVSDFVSDLGADVPVSFAADVAGGFDWAKDRVGAVAAAAIPTRIRVRQSVTFMLASK